ncbi:MAG: PDZ domain-containing protein [Gammaproteobacteria bacterium]|nr:PDZ domain-containing protein [Gammaproteobacteria bacterium]
MSILENLPEPVAMLWSDIEQKLGSRHAVNAINIIVIALFAHSLAQWTWQIAQPRLSQVIAQPIGESGLAKRSIDIQSILNANLFGKKEIPEESAFTTPDQVPLSSLNLILTGIVSAGAESIALISVSGQPQVPFAIGEEITQGAILDSVYPDRAILRRGNVLESLVLKDAAESLIESTEPQTAPDSGASISDIRSIGANSYSFPHQLIKEQLKDPKFLSDARIIPRKQGGGFLVQSLKKGSLYEKIGLRRGDVIESIDGQTINTAQDAMSHYQKLNGQGQVQIGIIRNGAPQMLQFYLE